MKIKYILLAGWLLLSGAALFSGQEKTSLREKTDETKIRKPLIRMDLLQRKERAAVAKRDIFVPQSQTEAMGELSADAGEKKPVLSAGEENVSGEPQEEPLNVRYLGYIQAAGKWIALVLFEGQTSAVKEGDDLGPEWKVLRITAGEIEIQGLDGKIRKFILEGERK